jgi:hypothetical protein
MWCSEVTQPISNGIVTLTGLEEAGQDDCVVGPASALPVLAATLQTRGSLALDIDAVRFQDINLCEIHDDVMGTSDRRKPAYDEEVRAGKPLLFDLDQTRWSDLCRSAE